MIDRHKIGLRNIYFSFDGTNDVLQIDRFELSRGKINVLKGGNGTGKTTLLKLLSGLIDTEASSNGLPLPGSIYIHQEPYLLKGSVLKNMKMSSASPEAVKGALETVGLAGFEKRDAKKISGGEQKRLALARAFAASPSIYLLDEPTANVDRESIASLERAMRGIVAAGGTILVATHHSSFGYRIADSMFSLEDGRLEESHENILRGSVEKLDENLLYFKAGDTLLRCPCIAGDFTTAVIGYTDIILSNRAMESSAQNCLEGTVTDVVPNAGGVYVRIDCGFPLSSKITVSSVEKLRIERGKTIFAHFKAVAVRLY